jgi:hypothetical protein
VWFSFAFPLWLGMVSIFSCVFWPFEFSGKCMELENIILTEVSQGQKTKNRMFSLMWTLDQGQTQGDWTLIT